MSPQLLPVALDAMGGDHAPKALVAGAVQAVREGLPVLLVGDEAALAPLVPRGLDLPVRHAPPLQHGPEGPVAAVRRQEGSSVRQAVAAVEDGAASAAVSCGHTGAVMAAALFGLGRVPGVERPAVTRALPRTDGGQLVVLDLGANVDCKPSHLAQFALMGSAYAREALGMPAPRVGLLSNGVEEGKGNELVRESVDGIAALGLDFVGRIEPQDALRGGCDVLVCDGFVGNVLLKTVEATADVVGTLLREEILRYPSARLGAWLLQGAFRRFRARTDWSSFGGAQLLGVRGVVLVGHGRSDAAAVAATLRHAAHCARQGLDQHLARALAGPDT